MRLGAVITVALVIVLTFGIPAASAQTGGPSVTLVSLDDSAFPTLTLRLGIVDSTGRPVIGLTPSSIEVLGDRQPAEVVSVSDVSDAEQAIAVVIVIDTSDSMAGSPLAAAKSSAISFLQGLGPNDEVAVLAFGSTVREVQPFTTDKAKAQSAIEQLETSGTTALYDAANQGVLTAARSALTRRVVILLGDGAEYGGASLSEADDAYKAARTDGVTIHTIALGYSADTAYFQQLSGLTGGVALNAPTPAELDTQWKEISGLLRQFVEVVVHSNVPGDGQTHSILIRVKTGSGQSEVTGTFKSSAVAPKVTVNGLDSPLKTDTTVTAIVDAQGQVAGVTFILDGNELSQDADSPFTAELDPASLAAGTHALTVQAKDETGTAGSAEFTFDVAALPPKVSLSINEGQTIDAPLSVTADVVSQTESNTVTVSVDSSTVETLTVAPYRFTLDPASLSEGAHTLTVAVAASNGQVADVEVGFTVIKSAAVGGGISPGWIIGGAALIAVAVIAAIVIVRRRSPVVAPPPVPIMGLEILTGPDKGRVFAITDDKQTIGRLSTAPIPLNDPTGGLHLSREHARVWKQGATAYIEDAGSRYRTMVNGRKIAEVTALTNDALIKVGEIEMIFHGPAPTAGDMRATRFDAGALPTALPDAEHKGPPADKTMLKEETKHEIPPTPRTVADAPLDEDEERHTRIKNNGEPRGPAEIEKPLRSTPLKPTSDTMLDDEGEEARRTQIKNDDEDDENRETRLKE